MITLQQRVHSTPTPTGWKLNKLHRVLRVRKGFKNAGMLEDNLLSLSYGSIVRKDIEGTEGLLPESFEAYQIVEPGNIVMRLTDLQNDKRSLRQGLVTERGIITSAYDALELDKGHDPRFWAYALLALDLAKYYYSLGGGVRQSIKFADFPNDWIAVPDDEIQKDIADFLDRETARVDHLIEKKRQLIERLDQKEKSKLSELVLRGVSPDSEYVQTNLPWRGRVPKHWTESRLKAHFRIRKRQGFSNLTVLSVYREFGVIEKDSRDDNINKTPLDLSSYQLVCPGDLVINKMKAWQGSLGVSRLRGITSPDYVVMVPTAEHHSQYVHYLLRAWPMPSVYHVISNGIRPDQWRLEPDRFLSLPVFLPPSEEQEAITEAIEKSISAIRRVIAVTRTSLDKLAEYRASLITAAVTGQIDLTKWRKRGEGDRRLDAIQEEMTSQEARA